MKKVEIDEDGKVVDRLAERNEEIKEKLLPVLNEFLQEKREMMALKKPEKLGYRFGKQIHQVLSSYGQMSVDRFIALEYDDIEAIWLKYLDLTAYYNRFFEIVDNKQMFCAFAGLNLRQYTELEEHEDEDIRNLMNSINASFIGLGFMAGESGNASPKAVNDRLRSKGEAGHSIISAAEDKIIEKSNVPTESELARRLEQMGIPMLK